MHVVAIKPESLFKALSDPTRLRIIRLLAMTREEICLCELVDALRLPQYNLSRHLKVLRQSGFLSSQKEGRWVYHRLTIEPEYLQQLHTMVCVLPDDDRVFSTDLECFNQRLELREQGRCKVGILSEALKSGTE